VDILMNLLLYVILREYEIDYIDTLRIECCLILLEVFGGEELGEERLGMCKILSDGYYLFSDSIFGEDFPFDICREVVYLEECTRLSRYESIVLDSLLIYLAVEVARDILELVVGLDVFYIFRYRQAKRLDFLYFNRIKSLI
jgi:hypothetical protein